MKTKTVLVLLATFLGLGGCGEGHQAGTKAYFGSPLGRHVSIETTAEQELHVGKMWGTRDGTTTQPAGWGGDDIWVTNKVQGANQTIPLVTAGNTAYQAQLGINGVNYLDAFGRNIVQPVIPPIMQYLQNRAQFNTNATQMGMTKLQVASGLVQGIFGGQIDYSQVAAHAEPGVKAIVDSRLNEMQADIAAQRKDAETQTTTNADTLKIINEQLAEMKKWMDAHSTPAPPPAPPHDEPLGLAPTKSPIPRAVANAPCIPWYDKKTEPAIVASRIR